MSKNRKHKNHDVSPVDRGKWVDLHDASACLCSAARITLRSRLSAVRRYLPMAALRAKETPEHIHRLRVSTRRVLAALKLYKDLLPPRQAARMRASMKRIRNVAGMARDLDVLSTRYQASDSKHHRRLLRQLRRSRRKSQHAIVELNRKLIETGKLEKRELKLLSSIRCQSDQSLTEFAQSQLQDQADRLFKCAKGDLTEVHQLHQFRIRAKKLRYTIELLHDVLPREIRTDIYPIICKAQDVLGELNDHSIASQRMKRLARKEKRPRAAKRFRNLCKQEKRKVEAARRDFHAWWTPAFRRKMHDRLNGLLKNSH